MPYVESFIPDKPLGVLASYTVEEIANMPYGRATMLADSYLDKVTICAKDAAKILGISAYKMRKFKENLSYTTVGVRVFYLRHEIMQLKGELVCQKKSQDS